MTDKHAVHYSSATDLWATPQDLFDKVHSVYHFTTDVCALPENAKCSHFYTPEQDGLKQEWKYQCWCNPPYGRSVTGLWVKKAFEESKKPDVLVVMLLPARTDTKWFHEFIYNKPGVDVEFIKGRLKFGGSKDAAPFPSMLVFFDRD